jgi:MFS family permease
MLKMCYSPMEAFMIRKRPQVLMYFVNALFWTTVYVYVPQFSDYIKHDIGATATMVGLIAGSYGVTQMLLRLPLGIWSDRLSRRKPFILAGIAMGGLSSLVMFFFARSPGCQEIAARAAPTVPPAPPALRPG